MIECVTDLDEIFRLLSECCGKPTYQKIDTDSEGCEVAVPMFAIGESDERRKRGKRKIIQFRRKEIAL